jgi:hypothetical protein
LAKAPHKRVALLLIMVFNIYISISVIIMIIKRITKTSLLLFAAISFASLLNASPTFALQSYNAMSTSDKALSYSYYKSIRTCFEKSNINEDIDQSKANDPPQWINDSAFGLNSEVNTGYLINDGKDTNGTAYCRDIIGRALSFWQVSGTDFLKGMGYTLKSDGTQWNFPDNSNQLTKFDSFIRSATTSELTNPNEYSLGLAALTATQDGCSATRVGLFNDQDEAIQRMATSKTNGYFTLLSPTDNAGTVTYILKREGNGSTVYSYLPGGSKGGGTECEQIASRLNSIAPAVAQATADNLYVTLSNKMFSSLSGAIKADCDTQPNSLLRTECNDGWRSTFNACFSTMKSSLAASGQNNADGSNTALYIIPGNQRIQELSLCIAKGTGADLNTIITALTEAVSSTPVPSGEDQLAKIGVPENVSTCGVDGIGWIVCPLATSISKGIDGIFNIVKGFLEFKAYTTNQGVGMYPAWSVMRNFANVAFVIAFIAIIYSQLTSAGISNYGIKKMLPRLIVAAILVNLSFWICGIAVDISNILGSSLSGLFTGLIPSVSGPAINVDWASATGAILTGTAIGGISMTVAVAGAGSFWALLWMLVPILISALFSILVAVIVLAGRQVLLIIFNVISPLAFVAYLLPNTQKWYEKWQSTFITLLLMYPIIALIFGGSQFAAAIVRSNASNDMTVVLLSLAIQVIPLAITPMVIKLSGGLLNRFAGIVNNPKRGPVDGLKNWAKDRQALATKRGLGSENPNFVNRMGQFKDRRRRTREGFGKANENRAESMWQNSKQGKAAMDAVGKTNLQSEIDKNEAAIRLKATAPIDLTLNARVTKMELDSAQAQEDQLVKEMATHASSAQLNALDATLRGRAQQATTSKGIADSAAQMAQGIQTQEYAELIQNSPRRASMAGGVDIHGASKAVANAMNVATKASHDVVTAEKTTMRDMQTGQLQIEADNRNNSLERRLAASSMINAVSNPKDMLTTIDDLSNQLQTATAAGDADEIKVVREKQQQFMQDVGGKLPMSIGGQTKGELAAGTFTRSSADDIIKTFNEGGYSGEKFANMSHHELAVVRDKLIANRASLDASRVTRLKQSITEFNSAAVALGKSPAGNIADPMRDIHGGI